MTQATPLWIGPKPGDTAGPEVSGSDLRAMVDDLYGEGIRDLTTDILVTASGTTLTIGTGSAVITGDDVAGQGKYRVRCTAAETKPWVAAPATNSRIDMLVWKMRDAQVLGGTQHGSFFEIVSGAAAASPTAPLLPPTAIPLFQWTVTSTSSSIGALTDLRQPITGGGAAMGTAAQILTAAQIAALSTAQKFPGRLIENSTTGKLQHVLTPGATPVDVAAITSQKAQGTYSGNGSTNRAIAVGFAPDLVVIVNTGANSGIATFSALTATTQQKGDVIHNASGNVAIFQDGYLTNTGFLVGTTTSLLLNYSGVATSYTWTAFKFV